MVRVSLVPCVFFNCMWCRLKKRKEKRTVNNQETATTTFQHQSRIVVLNKVLLDQVESIIIQLFYIYTFCADFP